MEFKHYSVMKQECIEMLNLKPNGVYMDATLGGGGHSKVIANQLDKNGKLICFDLDMDAINFAKTQITSSGQVIYIHDNYKNFVSHLKENSINALDGIIVDLGISSYQIDNPERGFSYMNDGKLNMCMDASSTFTAENVVNEYSEDYLANIFYQYGEEKFSRRIAQNIVEYRKQKHITSTLELAGIIEKSIPAKFRFSNGHPAKRVFQAIRIEVNGELKLLREFLLDCVRVGLKSGARLVVLTFHSLEDRIVKETFKELATDCLCDKKIPICICHHKAEVKLITKKPITATNAELEENSRSHSAKLRVVEKI